MDKKNLIAIIILIGISLIVFFLWIKPGHILSTGESGIPFYHLSATAQAFSNTWSDGLLGFPASNNLGNYGFFFIFALLSSVIPPFLLQGLLFFFFILISQIAIFYIARKTLPKSALWFCIASAIFYTFNLITVVNIWNRFQYPFMFFYAFLPLGFMLYVIGLEKKKFSYALIINVLIFLFPLAFTSIPMLELLWLLFGIYLMFFVVINLRDKQRIFFGLQFFILLGVLWIFFNAWWLLQFFSTLSATSYVSQSAYNQGSDLQTFTSISNSLGDLSDIFRLVHKSFFISINEVWHNVYGNPIMVLITYLIPFLAFLPLTFRHKPKSIYFFLGFSLITIFFIKGSAPPFGQLFTFLFTHLRLLEAFRNPFEKLSLLLPFGYAPLIAYSLFRVYQYVSKKNKIFSVLLPAMFVVLIIVSAFPLLNRWVFMSSSVPQNNPSIGYYVQVPSYYTAANNWLNSDTDQFRVLTLPIDGEGITYTWPYGYSGVEVSNGLFDKPFISYAQHSQYSDAITNQIQDAILHSPQYSNSILSLLNVKYIMTRSDIDYVGRQMANPHSIDSFLATASGSVMPYFTKVAQFGPLTFYKNPLVSPLIYSASSLQSVPSDIQFSNAMELVNFTKGDIFFNPDQNPLNESLPFSAKTTIITPYAHMLLDASSFPVLSLADAKNQLFIPHAFPPSMTYSLLQLKEDLETNATTDSDSLFFRKLVLSNKRLGEFVALPTETTQKNFISSMNLLQTFRNSNVENNNMYYFRSYLIAERLILSDRLSRSPASQRPLIEKVMEYVSEFFVQNSIEPHFSLITHADQTSTNRAVYDFSIPATQPFEILLKDDEFSSTETPLESIRTLQIDNASKSVTPIKKGSWISFGTVTLSKGEHEIQFFLPDKSNLITSEKNSSFTLSSGGTTASSKTVFLKNIDSHATYNISFDFWILKGNGAKVALTDNLATESGQISSYASFDTDGYNNDFVSKSFTYTLNPGAKNHFVIFTVSPFNDCTSVNAANPILHTRCIKDKLFYNQFSKQTILQIKNLKIEKIFTNEFILKHTNLSVQTSSLPTIHYFKKNSSQYTITVSNAKQPFLLVFSESFHSLWKLAYGDSKKIIGSHYLVNSYANAWTVNRKGSFTLNLEFAPENSFTLGKIVSGLAITLSILCLGIIWWRKKHA